MSKKIEVLIPGHTSYYVPVEEAKRLTASNQAIWQGSRRIVRSADISKRGNWVPRGKAAIYCDGEAFGPKYCTLQLI